MNLLSKTSIASVLAMLLIACSGSQSDATDNNTNTALKVGAGGGNGALQKTLADPAPAGAVTLTVETIADGLRQPWSIAWLPDGTMLVTERAGFLRIVRNGTLASDPVSGLPDTWVGNQAGLFDVLPHPEFSTNSLLYFAYAHGVKNANATRIGRAKFDGDTLSEFEVLYEAKPLKDTSHHYGGKLAWGPDGKLYFTVGEGSKYKERAQLADTSFGAVIRLNEDGSVPSDNPDFGIEGALPELYSKGHRNPQGLAFHPDGTLYEHEHGPRGGDEINIIEPGKNYGWPLASYGIDYNGSLITPYTEIEGTKQPFHYWTPSIAASGLAVYEGDMFADWQGDLLIGALAGQALHRIDLENGIIVGEERYLVDEGERIRDVRIGPDGAIYVTTNAGNRSNTVSNFGKVLRLTPARG